ncbi:MAG: hypothetical protein M3069_06205 [Chloroflexota bacterium]|nr:hypothetical protein [Chloroflexota bacterium]
MLARARRVEAASVDEGGGELDLHAFTEAQIPQRLVQRRLQIEQIRQLVK